jgi:hypothetical protein
MDKILRIGPPRAIGVSDQLYSFIVRLNEVPAEHWIYAFKLPRPVSLEYDPERVVFDPQRGLLFETEEAHVPGWIGHVDLWIASANSQVAADEAVEEKRRAEAQNREERDLLLRRINEKFSDLWHSRFAAESPALQGAR